MNAPLADAELTALAAQPRTAPLALQARGLGFGYAPGAPVFSGIDLDIHAQEIVCLLGGSGCGKSSLLRTLAGLQAPTQGLVEFLGTALTQPHPRAAVVFQQASLLPWLSVWHNVAFGLDFKHQPALDAASLRQRVALARALARQPQLLLADEPFSALDAITRAEMQELLVELVQRWHTAALLVTHDIDEAILVADRIVLMGRFGPHAGHIVRMWKVDIPHPRVEATVAVTALRLEILAALRTLHGAAEARPANTSDVSCPR
ncbi:ABC transporter ATP-binding protein [Comamonas sp. GB3 AK4-5]|uniref:ABC transporter ATP-binding protein n=1 Tax=Comamonas sp. GB3 AK4-5 TaxID=3231487 RepID=UPI00351DE9D0